MQKVHKPAMHGGKRFRLWLLVAAFVVGQLFMLAHGTEHADADEASHACLLCLTGHDLGSAVPPVIDASVTPPRAAIAPPAVAALRTPAGRRFSQSARGPPFA